MDPAQGLDFHHSTLPPLRRAKSLDRRTTESVMTVSQTFSQLHSSENAGRVLPLPRRFQKGVFQSENIVCEVNRFQILTMALLFAEVQRLKRAAAGFGMFWSKRWTTVLEYFSQHDIKNISIYRDFIVRWRSLLSKTHSLVLFYILYRPQTHIYLKSIDRLVLFLRKKMNKTTLKLKLLSKIW